MKLGNLLRIILGFAALWWLWLGWTPTYFTLSENLAKPRTEAELNALASGTYFVAEGIVHPSLSTEKVWQGRFTYVHYQSKDTSTQAGKEQRIVLIQDQRPAVTFEWDSGKRWIIPAESYQLDQAPRVEPRFWPRKSLWLMPVDEWHESSRGFRPGESAIAYGQIDPFGSPRVDQLLQYPLESASKDIARENGFRKILTIVCKVIATLFILIISLPRRSSTTETPIATP
ncbi:MAG: hypothetical protein NWS48_12310 [Akkermansiaceae bacterium]|nr:hypothetical protein [Akkermansiaceae bacterium]